ncbi:fimbrial protein [Vibrio metschnikovii]|uniref:fimbrial protein n=1 Tax=Vibrio metschnikovii TaxID=28172 RepID=UPI001C30E2C0|nr:fimbrial protein [Vibrio metschnikovii]
MKKSNLSFFILAALACSQSYAADGKITFSGAISAATCTVTGGNGILGGASDFEVRLPTVSNDALANNGDVAGSTKFSLIIGSEDEAACTNGEIASLMFESPESPLIDPNTGRLKNMDGDQYAKNVQIELLNNNGEVIDLYNNTNITNEMIVGNTAVLNFTARYRAIADSVVPGEVKTNIVYSVTYN